MAMKLVPPKAVTKPILFLLCVVFIGLSVASGVLFGVQDSLVQTANDTAPLDVRDFKYASYLLGGMLVLMMLIVTFCLSQYSTMWRMSMALVLGGGAWIIGVFLGHERNIRQNDKKLFWSLIGCLVAALTLTMIVMLFPQIKGGSRFFFVVLIVGLLAYAFSIMQSNKVQQEENADDKHWNIMKWSLLGLCVAAALIGGIASFISRENQGENRIIKVEGPETFSPALVSRQLPPPLPSRSRTVPPPLPRGPPSPEMPSDVVRNPFEGSEYPNL